MAKEWTRRERKEHVTEKYHPRRKKWFITALLAIVMILLVYGLVQTIKMGDLTLSAAFFIAILVMVPVTIFAIDTIAWEPQ